MTETQIATDYLAIARAYAADPSQWPIQPRFDPLNRWYACLADTDDVQVWLLSWLPGQATDLHDHGGSEGAFTVVRGELYERSISEDAHGEATESGGSLGVGDGRSFGPHHVHRIVNNGIEPAVTVHVYSPSLSSMTRYEIIDNRLTATAVDRAGDQW